MTQPQPAPLVDLEELQALAKAATQAPWCVHPNGTSAWRGTDWDTVNNSVGSQYRHVCNATSVDSAGIADIEFIVAMRNSFEAIIQELRALRATAQTHAELVDALQWLPAGCTVDFFDEDMFLAECRDKGWSYPTPEAE